MTLTNLNSFLNRSPKLLLPFAILIKHNQLLLMVVSFNGGWESPWTTCHHAGLPEPTSISVGISLGVSKLMKSCLTENEARGFSC